MGAYRAEGPRGSGPQHPRCPVGSPLHMLSQPSCSVPGLFLRAPRTRSVVQGPASTPQAPRTRARLPAPCPRNPGSLQRTRLRSWHGPPCPCTAVGSLTPGKATQDGSCHSTGGLGSPSCSGIPWVFTEAGVGPMRAHGRGLEAQRSGWAKVSSLRGEEAGPRPIAPLFIFLEGGHFPG